MNAFAGFISLNHEAVSSEKLESIAAGLVGYVPDQKYFFGDQEARFAQLIRYNTPESFHESTYQNYVHDIRLDNREELAERLGVKLTEKIPDSQLVFKAYERWGEKCLDYLRGDFAFAIWDAQRKELFCARDPMGHRLIYYCHAPGRFFGFSSVISGLLAAVPVEINLKKVLNFLDLTSPNHEETFYRNIFRLKAGEVLVLKQNKIALRTYWALGEVKPVWFKKDSEYLDAFLDVFGKAVRTRLRSAFPIGAHLSGGLDSSSVVAMAVQELPKLTTFSAFPPIGYQGPKRPNWNLDDTHYVEMIANQYPQVDPHYVRSESRDLFSGLQETYAYLDAPCLNPCNRIWIHGIFERASERNIRVLLTGGMGNATISWRGVTFKQRLGKIARMPYQLVYPDRWDVPNPREWMIFSGMNREALSYYQGQRAYWGIELRDPTHDQMLVEFCLGLPNSQFARQGLNRMLIRRAMKGLLPEALCMRRDQGGQLSDWPDKIRISYDRMKKEWSSLRTNPIIQGVIDVKQIDNFVASWPKAELESREAMWQYRIEWLRAFFVARFINWMEHDERRKKSLDDSRDYSNS